MQQGSLVLDGESNAKPATCVDGTTWLLTDCRRPYPGCRAHIHTPAWAPMTKWCRGQRLERHQWVLLVHTDRVWIGGHYAAAADPQPSLHTRLVPAGAAFLCIRRVTEKGNYTERDASNLIKQILSGVHYLHLQGVGARATLSARSALLWRAWRACLLAAICRG